MTKMLTEMIERHADEAAFLWERRERACRSPVFDLDALIDVDRRLEANLEGLVIAAEVGLEKSMNAVPRGGAPELFTALHVAAELGDVMELARLLVTAQQKPGGERAAAMALAWLSPERARVVLGDLVAPECPPPLQGIGIAAHVARRQDPGEALQRALGSPDLALRGRAARAVGQLGRRDLLPFVRAEGQSGEGEAGVWAAWSAVLLGDASALPRLWAAAAEGGGAALAACDLAVRAVDAAEAVTRIQELSSSPVSLPAALAGAAARGDSACIQWVLDVPERDPALARRAMWVFATITGVRLEPPLAVREPTIDPSDAVVARSVVDPWEDLPSPDVAALRARWEEVRSRFPAGERRLGGRVVEPVWIEECLRTGLQPWRASAALERARAGRGGLFPVRAPGQAQAALLRAATT